MATILVVEDERPLREFLAQALQDNGHQVLQAFHGQNALSVIDGARPVRPDMVLSDVMMPLMGGVELCQRVKADPDTATIPVILMSSAPARHAAGSGADAFIAKPFDLDVLDALIAQVLAAHAKTA
jgi:CheY-like chemotaxis protein